MIRRGSSRPCCVVSGCSWWWFSEPFLGVFLGLFSGPFSWGFDGGNLWEPFVVLWAMIPLPNPWVKGLDIGVFRVLGLEVFLAGFLRFHLFGQVLVGLNLAMDSSWGVPIIPKVLFNPWSDSRDRSLDLGELTRGCCSSRAAQATPVWPVLLTGLTGATLGGFLLGWTSGCVRCCPVFRLFRVWVSLEVGRPVWWFGGFQALTGLTGVLHRPDRCEAT
jgi:hypothetical protein